MDKKGFTLEETIIVLVVAALICIVAAIAIPRPGCNRIGSNEGAAIGTLRTIATNQAQFQSGAKIDQDQDGTGEFALLAELTGYGNLRTDGGTKGAILDLAYLTKALTPDGAQGSKSGYYFQIYLPTDGTGSSVTDNGNTPPPGNEKYGNAQETKFRAYAWPIARHTGRRAFAIDQAGQVFACDNVDTSGEPVWGGGRARWGGVATEPGGL
jgi:type II secretory pathway pseudopilin PulG